LHGFAVHGVAQFQTFGKNHEFLDYFHVLFLAMQHDIKFLFIVISLRLIGLLAAFCGLIYLVIRFLELSTIQIGFSQPFDFNLPFIFWPALTKAALPFTVGTVLFLFSRWFAILCLVGLGHEAPTPKPKLKHEKYDY